MIHEEHDAYYAGQEDGEVGYKNPQQPDESSMVYARYLQGFRDGQNRAYSDARSDGASAEFWRQD